MIIIIVLNLLYISFRFLKRYGYFPFFSYADKTDLILELCSMNNYVSLRITSIHVPPSLIRIQSRGEINVTDMTWGKFCGKLLMDWGSLEIEIYNINTCIDLPLSIPVCIFLKPKLNKILSSDILITRLLIGNDNYFTPIPLAPKPFANIALH